MAPEFQHLEKLPLAERIQLVEDLWDSIAQDQGANVPVPEWQKAELARRREAYARDPDPAQPWSEVKRSILEFQRCGPGGRRAGKSRWRADRWGRTAPA